MLLRQRVQTTVNLFLLNATPVPKRFLVTDTQSQALRFLAHCALRLSCNHAGYAPLWREQVGGAWREERAPFDWPALAGDDARWRVRAAIDAVVADAYGLSREQYAHVLSTFSHKSYPAAPALCLAAYDELAQIGLEAFARRHDPYWDIPLNEALPQPVIELPALAAAESAPAQQALDLGESQAPPPDQADGYDRLKALLSSQVVITSGSAQEALGLDAAAVRPLLKRLVDEGLARQEGERRGTRYRKL